ncbi:cobalt transporter [Acinetobacter corruptisaponis]|uniref:Cobalt transporter n=1 Tax=Acinetobacter corruptisaponis TaxID=3045147 RepID=A0ABY8S0S0_9GAMM|nr:cobalt transporter [Acinetobacter sp. KCTC 92772]WHP05218.1 cobalt transporter [Acinetobacter sp. KCTC 92772]
MALEQQDRQITDHANQGVNSKEKPQASFQSQAGFISANGSMNVSFYYIPHMSSVVEATRVRKALVPFVDLLVEHSIDLDARHLTLYHHLPIDEVTAALQRLSLGAELQQTMSHYEPVEIASFQQEKTDSFNQNKTFTKNQLNPIQQFFYSALEKLGQWIKVLQGKKDE